MKVAVICDRCGRTLKHSNTYRLCGACHFEEELLMDVQLSPEYLAAKLKMDELRDKLVARRKKKVLSRSG